jgi:hypothetical protein
VCLFFCFLGIPPESTVLFSYGLSHGPASPETEFLLVMLNSLYLHHCALPLFSDGWLEESRIENGNAFFLMGCSQCCEYVVSPIICALLDFMQRGSHMSPSVINDWKPEANLKECLRR